MLLRLLLLLALLPTTTWSNESLHDSTSYVYHDVLYPQTIIFNKILDEQERNIRYAYRTISDNRGIVWIGNANELIRFDGYQTLRFQPTITTTKAGEVSSAKVSVITDLYSDSATKLFVSTSQGLFKFNPVNEQFTFYQNSYKDPKTNQVRAIRRIIKSQYNADHIWLAQKDSVSLFNMRTEKFIKHIELSEALNISNMSVMNLAEYTAQKQQKLLLATFGKGLVEIDLTTEKITQIDLALTGRQKNIRNLMLDKNILWLGTQSGLFQINLTTGKQKSYHSNTVTENNHLASNALDNTPLANDNIGAIFKDNQGRIWIGNHQGLSLYHPQSDSFINYISDSTNSTSSVGGSILSISQSNNGTLYISGTSGIDSVHPNTFAFQYRTENGVGEHQKSVAHFLAQKNRPVALTNKLQEINKNGGIYELYPIENSATKEPATQTLIRTYHTVYLFNHRQKTMIDLFAHFPVINNYANPRSIFSDNLNRYYIYAKGGIYRLDNNELIPQPLAQGKNQYIASAAENDNTATIDSNNTIWSLSPEGLHSYNVHTQQYQLVTLPFSKQKNAISILCDNHDILWITTISEGVWFYNPATGDIKQIKQSLPYNRTKALMADSQGYIWLSSYHGVLRLTPDTGTVTHFGREEGLPNDYMEEYTSISYDNNILAVSMTPEKNDYVLIDTRFVQQNKQAPKVFIDNIKINNKTIPINEKNTSVETLTIASNIKHLAFTMLATHPFRVDMIEYQHQLIGFEEQPITTGANNRLITYTNLSSGEYTIVVRAKSKHGVWSDNTTFSFIITPTIWQTLWAKLIYVVLLLTVIFVLIKLRTRTLQQQKNQLTKLVATRTKALEQALNQSQLLYTSISHEFRTPLTLILGPLTELKRTVLNNNTADTTTLKHCYVIEQNSRHLLKLVDQLLSLAKLKVSDANEKIEFNLSLTLSAIVKLTTPLANTKNIAITLKMDNDLWLKANTEQIEFIVVNLLSNAIKYTKPGGDITISCYQDNTCQSKPQVMLRVCDSGVGIASDDIEKIFAPFYRASACTSTKVDDGDQSFISSGIGLLIVKEFVDANAGTISVTSKIGIGSEFTLHLPLIAPPKLINQGKYEQVANETINVHSALVQEFITQESLIQERVFEDRLIKENSSSAPSTKHEKNTIIQTKTAHKKGTILIVEDNPQLLDYLYQCLTDDFTLLIAKNGKEGLEQALAHIPDIILSDIMMPIMDGVSLCNTLYNNIITQHIPVILLTAKVDYQTEIEGLTNKAIDFIHKPFNVDVLILKLSNVLELHTRQKKIRHNQLLINLPETNDHIKPAINESDIFLVTFQQICQKNFADSEFTVQQLASKLAMSTRKLQRLTSTTLGHSPNELLRQYRLNKAYEKLTKGQSVTETYLECGFKSASYFSRAFKDYKGFSPSTMKKVR